jgi:hypothetical protein
MKIRINNIGARKPAYIGSPPADAHRRLSIVLYYPCQYYGKLDEYLADGWEYVDEGTRITKNNCTISKSFFDLEELLMSIADLEYDSSEDCTNLETVGERVLNLSKQNREDFFEVYELAARKLREACSDDED